MIISWKHFKEGQSTCLGKAVKAVLTEKSGAGDNMAEIFHLGSSEGTLHQVYGETMEAAKIQHMAEMLLMIIQGTGEHQHVVQVDEAERQIAKEMVHFPLEGLEF